MDQIWFNDFKQRCLDISNDQSTKSENFQSSKEKTHHIKYSKEDYLLEKLRFKDPQSPMLQSIGFHTFSKD